MQEHIFGKLALVHLTFGSCTAPPYTLPITYHPFNGPGMCTVENFQRLRFGYIQSPKKSTGKPKRMTITTKPTTGRRIRRQEVGGDGMKVGVTEERGIGGIVICPFYGPRPLGTRPMPFTTLSTCAFLMPIPTRERRLRQ